MRTPGSRSTSSVSVIDAMRHPCRIVAGHGSDGRWPSRHASRGSRIAQSFIGSFSEAHGAADDLLHDLARAAVQPLHPPVAPQPGDLVLVDVAVTAVQLQAAVQDL